MTGEQITRKQIAEQLNRCARFDGRTLDPQTFEDWYELLGDLPYGDVKDAVTSWYRTDRRWIMPADIVAHHQALEAGRAVERIRQAPPQCWGRSCFTRYVLSAREGSLFAFPDRPHDPGCNAMQGVLMFNPDGENARWAVMPVDPASFDEVAWEENAKAVAAKMRRYREAVEADPGYGPGELEDGR